jgi:LSD1 subclass zinc finger protein
MNQSNSGQMLQLVCSGCRTVLLYPPGAQNVRCARCSVITPVSSSSNQQQDMAQLSCCNPNCRVQLMYPRGATQVQCSLCRTLNDAQQANQLGHVVCEGCQITLMYAYGARSVKCAVCNSVTSVSGETTMPQQQSSEPQQVHTTVLVENPAGAGDTNVAIGTKT